MRRIGCFLLWALFAIGPRLAQAQDPRQLVRQAVDTELKADAADHSRWIYFDVDRKPDATVSQWVAETADGSLHRVLVKDGQPVPLEEQKRQMDRYIGDLSARSKARKSGQHDDEQAAKMLQMLPAAFLWSIKGTQGSQTILHFKPDPNFHAPDMEARVFGAMEGDMAVDTAQHRIASIKGRLVNDVKFFGGLFGGLEAGGTFGVERREVAPGIWQITETHVHIQGHVLLFKTISEQEDEVKTHFRQLPGNVTFAQAEATLLQLGESEQARR